MKNKNPFEIEIVRAELAAKKKYKALVKTYSTNFPEISDHNTPKMWDGINLAEKKIGQHPMEDDRIKIVSKLLPEENSSVFNIGFGSANLEKEYFKSHAIKNVQWHGIDISPKSVKKANKDFPFASFSLGNILKLSSKANTYDYVVSLEVLEHIPPSKTMKSLKEIYRVIKPGKYFIVSVPLNEGLETMIARGENPNAHVRTYTPDLLTAELQMIGFTIVKEKKLYAFHRLYKIKTFIARYLLKKKQYNNLIILAKKPLTYV